MQIHEEEILLRRIFAVMPLKTFWDLQQEDRILPQNVLKNIEGEEWEERKKNNKTGTRNTTLRPEFSFLTPNTHISWGRRLRKSSNLASKEQGRSKHTCEMRSWQAASSLSLAFIFLLESIWALSSCLLRFTRDFTSDFILLMYSRAMVNSSSITPFTSAN